jgi:hypothetical protein
VFSRVELRSTKKNRSVFHLRIITATRNGNNGRRFENLWRHSAASNDSVKPVAELIFQALGPILKKRPLCRYILVTLRMPKVYVRK